MKAEEIESKLRIIGFSGFIHIIKEQRDGRERLVRWTKFQGEWIGIILVKVNENWIVERLHGNSEFLSYFNKEIVTVDDILLFFKLIFFAESPIKDFI